MRPPKFLPTVTEEEPMSDPVFARPDLCSTRVIPGGFLHAAEYPVRQLGTGGAWLMIGHSGQQTGAGR